MLTSINGQLKGWFYEDGYLWTSSQEYSLYSTDKYIHLTNDAVQKHSPDFGKFEAANKFSYSDFQKILDQDYPQKSICFIRDIVP